MTNKKGRICEMQPLKENVQADSTLRARSIAKDLIVRLALWNWLPWPVAAWLIQRGGMKHV